MVEEPISFQTVSDTVVIVSALDYGTISNSPCQFVANLLIRRVHSLEDDLSACKNHAKL